MAEMKVLSDIKDLKSKDVDLAKQITSLSEDTLGCGFGKKLLFLGRDIDLKGFDKNINAVCTTTINNPSTFYDGDSSFVSVRYHTKDWQEVTFISFKDGLEWKLFKKAGVWGTWSSDSDEITDLQTKLGIPYATWLDNPDFNTLITFNRYRIGGGTNSPDNNSVWYLEVNPVQEGIVYQRAKCIYGGSLGKQCSRVLRDGSWTQWKTIATTDKIDILCTPTTGYTIFSQNCYQINNVIYVNIRFNKTDDSAMSADGFINPLSLPISVGDTTLNFCGNTANGFWSSTGSCLVSGTSILVTPVKECTGGRVSGVIVL